MWPSIWVQDQVWQKVNLCQWERPREVWVYLYIHVLNIRKLHGSETLLLVSLSDLIPTSKTESNPRLG